MSDDHPFHPADDDSPNELVESWSMDLHSGGGPGSVSWVDDLVDAWAGPTEPTEAVDSGESSGQDRALANEVTLRQPAGDSSEVRFDVPEDPDALAGLGSDGDGTVIEPGGDWSMTSVVESMGLVGNAAAAEVLAGLDIEVVGGREMSAALDGAGLDARVEHGDIGDLRERLDAGVEIVLGGAAGAAHALVVIDSDAGQAVLEPLAGGPRRSVPLDDLVDAWDQMANELLVVATEGVAVSFGGSDVCILPLSLEDIDGGH